MWGLSEEPAAAPAAPEPSAAEGPMDINTAVQEVLKKALAHDGLARGLREACRAIEMGEAELCILAEDCNQPDYKKLIEGLCTEKSVNLISVPTNKQLGEWSGVRNSSNCCFCVGNDLMIVGADKEMNAWKTGMSCS